MDATYHREYRARRKANGGGRLTVPAEFPQAEKPPRVPRWPGDPAGAVAAWSKRRLRVPPGHRAAGKRLELPEFAVRFFADALQPGIRESGLFCARKNAKSAVLATLVLAHLAEDGPLRRLGWRCGAASVSKDKAVELWQQCADIAAASGLEGIRFGKVPRVITSRYGRAEFLSADRTAGHSSGFDLAIADEIGLYPERGRDLVAGLISSTSARDGRLIAISVIGDSPLSRELIGRGDDPAVAVHVHAAPDGCALDDESAWAAANPALGTVKSRDYMRDMARRAAANPSEQSAFRSFDLNQPGAPLRQTIVPADQWEAVVRQEMPPRLGPLFVGFDLGGSVSLTAAALYWPQTGRLESYGACGDVPNLRDRGAADGVGERYQQIADRGELRTYPGRVTPAASFLGWIVELLDGWTPTLALADRYRQAEAMDALTGAGAAWRMEWRAQGTGKDGSADIRAFQRAVAAETLRPGPSILLTSAVGESEVRYDDNGNPGLQKRRQRGRIDALSAAVLAVGAGERATARPVVPQPTIFLSLEDLD